MMFFSYISTYFAAGAGDCDPNKTFFGIPVWYKYLVKNASPGACDFQNLQVWPPDKLVLILVALLDIILRIAGMVSIGFIIYGGISYVLSQGEPDKTKEALQTIINALIGLVVALISVAIVSFLGNRLGG